MAEDSHRWRFLTVNLTLPRTSGAALTPYVLMPRCPGQTSAGDDHDGARGDAVLRRRRATCRTLCLRPLYLDGADRCRQSVSTQPITLIPQHSLTHISLPHLPSLASPRYTVTASRTLRSRFSASHSMHSLSHATAHGTVVVYLVWQEIGASALVGVFALLAFIPLQVSSTGPKTPQEAPM